MLTPVAWFKDTGQIRVRFKRDHLVAVTNKVGAAVGLLMSDYATRTLDNWEVGGFVVLRLTQPVCLVSASSKLSIALSAINCSEVTCQHVRPR